MNRRIPTMAAAALMLAATAVPADQRPVPPPSQRGDANECTNLDLQVQGGANQYVISAHVSEECKGSLYAFAWIEVNGEMTNQGFAEGMSGFTVESGYISVGEALEICARLEGEIRFQHKVYPVSLAQCLLIPAPERTDPGAAVEWNG